MRLGKYIVVACLLMAVGWLSACGQRGPLYLPDDEHSQTQKKKDR